MYFCGIMKYSNQIYKYPRTEHIVGSKLQPGDEDMVNVPFSKIRGRNLVVEEKVDGANSGISVIEDCLMLQSRGHYLTGGYRERHFDLFKTWANNYTQQFKDLLGEKYVMYSEWLYAKHTIFYDKLPHYNLEFDIYDTETGLYLDTPTRKQMLKPLPFVHSVKVLFEGKLDTKEDLYNFVGNSYFISDEHKEKLSNLAKSQGLDSDKILNETDLSGLMEGLYIKVEEDGVVKERYKFVRNEFLQTVSDSETHWLDRPIIPNQLVGTIDDLFI